MLQTIHDKLKGIFAVAILAALGIVFVFWGVNFSSNISSFTKAKGIEVNGREIAVEDVRRDYQEQLSRMQVALGDAGVPEQMRESIQQRVLDQAVRSELLRQRTRELGFEATDDEVLESIRQVPAFQIDGTFSRPSCPRPAVASASRVTIPTRKVPVTTGRQETFCSIMI